ncbi:phosphatase PAP2 family protein [Kocuria sp.]|uniref:phosphatase PAP2 family protein n=1 Tax=Kocuria sp. TaxID=1871328 RepID=UPI0026DC9E4F|nr:phosphatase PAP2 family protein [Kocuria sp.]MDO4918343.1 phosphatase PAP2 family protein [Kocuria sp.]
MSFAPFPPGPGPRDGGRYTFPPHGSYGTGQPGPSGHGTAPARTVSARTVVAALVALVVLWGLVPLIAHGGLGTVTGQALDEAALKQAKADRTTFFPRIVLVAAQYLPEVVAVAAGVLALVWAVRHRRWNAALLAVGAVLAANLTTQVLKHGVLDKPDLGVQEIASNSFPSGHTTAAASLLMAVFLVAPPHRRARTGRWGAFLAALVGMTTVLNGWHRPTDAVAALLVVAGWGVLAALLAQVLDAVVDRVRRSGTTAAGTYRRLRADRSRRQRETAWSEDRGDSAFVPPARERAEREREWAASSARQNAHEHSPGQYAPNQYAPGGMQGSGQPWAGGTWGAPQYPVRPRLGTAVALIVVSAALLTLAVWWPYPTVAGTFAGRITLAGGYLGIAAAAALGWSLVGHRLRPAAR